ncbi:MAG: sugar transferase [Actinobacteria bacterium]|nr:sugar transferase [Actinomycetota bacterium]MBI3687713.1 sugar transferase [Actinomycetota bacterium]
MACLDVVAVTVALCGGYFARFGVVRDLRVGGVPYVFVGALVGAGWIAALVGAGAYRVRFLGTGAEEYKRITNGTFRTWSITAVACYAAKVDVARGFVLLAIPSGLVLLLGCRVLARHWLVTGRARGRSMHRVLVVGDRTSAYTLARQLHREHAAGFTVVGTCLPDQPTPTPTPTSPLDDELPVLGTVADAADVALASGVDTVAIAASSAAPAEAVRRIAWALEGSGIDLVVAPSITDVAGPRVSVRPVAGLPLLHVDQPELSGARWLAKQLVDRVGAVALLGLLAPVFVVTAASIRMTSPGPAMFRQVRIGRDGQEFRVFKFRTMYADAEGRLAALRPRNETDGLLFKIADDPRVTPLGRFLRRTSLDELPQLLNVLLGHMSLVGPRPLPVKDSDFVGDVRRRLRVRPGITGLWQVAGRSQLAWEDTVRLDLYYVENWTISLDLAIMLRTVGAVLRGTGAC